LKFVAIFETKIKKKILIAAIRIILATSKNLITVKRVKIKGKYIEIAKDDK
jgi:hypothetical protein